MDTGLKPGRPLHAPVVSHVKMVNTISTSDSFGMEFTA